MKRTCPCNEGRFDDTPYTSAVAALPSRVLNTARGARYSYRRAATLSAASWIAARTSATLARSVSLDDAESLRASSETLRASVAEVRAAIHEAALKVAARR